MPGVFVLNDTNTLVSLEAAHFASEDDFWVLLAKFPELLAGDQIDPSNPRRWVLVRREAAIPSEKNGQLNVHLEFSTGGYLTDDDFPDTGELQLDWNQVSKIMQSVKRRGILQKDLRWNTSYIGEKF